MEDFLPDIWRYLLALKILIFIFLGNISTTKISVEKLGRIWEPKAAPETDYPVTFKAKPLVQKYDDPYKQAEYAYSLIESEV